MPMLWERTIEEVLLKHNWEEVPTWELSSTSTDNHQYSQATRPCHRSRCKSVRLQRCDCWISRNICGREHGATEIRDRRLKERKTLVFSNVCGSRFGPHFQKNTCFVMVPARQCKFFLWFLELSHEVLRATGGRTGGGPQGGHRHQWIAGGRTSGDPQRGHLEKWEDSDDFALTLRF